MRFSRTCIWNVLRDTVVRRLSLPVPPLISCLQLSPFRPSQVILKQDIVSVLTYLISLFFIKLENKSYLFLFYMHRCFGCLHIYAPPMPEVQVDQNRALGLLELEVLDGC